MIDWSPFDSYPEHECECACGTTWYSHGKAVAVSGSLTLKTRKPCPACGKDDNIRTMRSTVETFTIGRL